MKTTLRLFYYDCCTFCLCMYIARRPDVPGLVWTDGSFSNASAVCCFCLGASSLYLPQYKIMQTFFVSFGGYYAFRGVSVCSCYGSQSAAGGSYAALMQALQREVLTENSAATQNFYLQVQCQCVCVSMICVCVCMCKGNIFPCTFHFEIYESFRI